MYAREKRINRKDRVVRGEGLNTSFLQCLMITWCKVERLGVKGE
jgi:hypothetical protein